AGRSVRDQTDLERFCLSEELGLSNRQKSPPIEGVRGVRDELAKENLLVAIQRVNDQAEDLADFGLELVTRGHDRGREKFARARSCQALPERPHAPAPARRSGAREAPGSAWTGRAPRGARAIQSPH